MATGDQNDILGRIARLIPISWFESSHAIRDAIAAGLANAHAFIYSFIAYVRLQTRILTATDGFLDVIAQDFFGSSIMRAANQSDASFRARIIINIFRERATRKAIIKVLQDLTGRTPIVIEPQRPADCGAYGGTDSITIVGTPQIYRSDWQGNQLLSPNPRTNIITQSSAFDNAAWTKNLYTMVPAAISAPDGTLTGQKLTDTDNTSNVHTLLSPTSTALGTGGTGCASVFLQQGDRPYAVLRLQDTSNSSNYCYAVFNLSTGAVLQSNTAGAGANVSAGIVNVGGGWYRCFVSGVPNPGGSGVRMLIGAPLTNTNSTNYTGVAGQGIYVWGAQVEAGATPTSYIPTTTATATVTDYVLSANGAITFAAAPLQGAALSWTGSYASTIQAKTVSVTGAPFSAGDGVSTSFSLAPKYGFVGGYGAAGAYGSVLLPYQAFVIAYRPLGTGIPYVSGYGSSPGGYSQASRASYASISSSSSAISDSDIYAAIDSVKPAATIIWTNISS